MNTMKLQYSSDNFKPCQRMHTSITATIKYVEIKIDSRPSCFQNLRRFRSYYSDFADLKKKQTELE